MPSSLIFTSFPYTTLFRSTVFVRDHDRSLQFFVDHLGFSLIADNRFEGRGRWVAVAPPDGSAILALVVPGPGSEEYELIGRRLDRKSTRLNSNHLGISYAVFSHFYLLSLHDALPIYCFRSRS